uniref:Uncharacterized protein n=1 Tax=Arundo donax TaxID=35708 RepID=A0A0A9GRC0_ARUDO
MGVVIAWHTLLKGGMHRSLGWIDLRFDFIEHQHIHVLLYSAIITSVFSEALGEMLAQFQALTMFSVEARTGCVSG